VTSGPPEPRPAPRHRDPLLTVTDLRTYFNLSGTQIKAVDGVTFTVGEGASVGVVGESGSGKSVMALSVLRLVDRPGYIDGGSIIFRDRDLAQLTEREMEEMRGHHIGLVPQNPMSALNPVYTVGRQLIEAIRAHRRLSGSEAWAEGVRLLQMVGIPAPDERMRSFPHSMSGGMLQRVTIAMALANEPELLILDEPTTALDVTIQAQILDLLLELRSRVNVAVLLITHDLGVVSEVCEEVIVMYGGRIMEHATVDQVLDDPQHPYTIGLLSCIPDPSMKGQRLKAIDGTVPSPLAMPSGCPFAPRCPSAMEACAQMPELKTTEDGRRVACWLR
jgi:oligopeptide/dipeptide ABC transporter ATP-binding protein